MEILWMVLALIAAAAIGWFAAMARKPATEPPPIAPDTREILIAGNPQFSIRYRDENDNETSRVIRVESLRFMPKQGDYLIDAYCSYQKAQRSFYSGRIVECLDLKTGLPVDNLATHLRTLPESIPGTGSNRSRRRP